MHDQLWHTLEPAIASLNEAEKLELIERLVQSLRSTKNGQTEAEAVERQRKAFRRVQDQLATHTPGKDAYAQLGYSNEAHDKILYDLEQK